MGFGLRKENYIDLDLNFILEFEAFKIMSHKTLQTFGNGESLGYSGNEERAKS